MNGDVRIQLMQVYSQTSTSTIVPRRAAGVSGAVLIQRSALRVGSLLAALAIQDPARTARHSSGRTSFMTASWTSRAMADRPATGAASLAQQYMWRVQPRSHRRVSWRPGLARPEGTAVRPRGV